jgi:hypothetical protein
MIYLLSGTKGPGNPRSIPPKEKTWVPHRESLQHCGQFPRMIPPFQVDEENLQQKYLRNGKSLASEIRMGWHYAGPL